VRFVFIHTKKVTAMCGCFKVSPRVAGVHVGVRVVGGASRARRHALCGDGP
jgi:hypothetical protein